MGSKDIEIRKVEFVTKTQFLCVTFPVQLYEHVVSLVLYGMKKANLSCDILEISNIFVLLDNYSKRGVMVDNKLNQPRLF